MNSLVLVGGEILSIVGCDILETFPGVASDCYMIVLGCVIVPAMSGMVTYYSVVV